jgi:hypothetical protein
MLTEQQRAMVGVYSAFPTTTSKFFSRRIKKSLWTLENQRLRLGGCDLTI